MKQVEVKGHVYAIGKLPALTALHVARRIAPIMSELGTSIQALLATAHTFKKEDNGDALPQVMGPALDVIAHMSDEDVNYIINNCLAVVGRVQEGGRPAPVMPNKVLTFNDIDMTVLLRLTIETVIDNLAEFFPFLSAVTDSPASSEVPETAA